MWCLVSLARKQSGSHVPAIHLQRPNQIKTKFSPNSLLWGSLLEKRLAAICSGRVPGACPPRVRHVSDPCPPCPPWVRFGHASKPWPARVRHVSAFCLPCVRLESVMAASPNFVRHVSASCPACPPLCLPWVWCGRASELCPPCFRHVSALCPPWVRFSCISELCPPCVRQVSACVLACCGAGKTFSHYCATHSVYIARPLASFLHIHIFILAHQIRTLLAHPMLEKLFGVYAGIIIEKWLLVRLWKDWKKHPLTILWLFWN